MSRVVEILRAMRIIPEPFRSTDDPLQLQVTPLESATSPVVNTRPNSPKARTVQQAHATAVDDAARKATRLKKPEAKTRVKEEREDAAEVERELAYVAGSSKKNRPLLMGYIKARKGHLRSAHRQATT